MQHRVCIISEDLSLPLDEGIKGFARSLIRSWPVDCPVLGLSVRSQGEIEAPNMASVKANRLLLNYKLWAKIRRFRPYLLCYVPSPSATIFSFLRSRVLKLYWPRAKVVMVSLQPRHYGWVSRHLIPLLSPDMVFVQSEETMRQLVTLGCPTEMLPSGVDLEKFTPVSSERKAVLRTKYALEPETFTVLHVGHIKKGRNIEFLIEVRREHAAQVILLGSSLPNEDRTLLTAQLREQGVIVFDRYLSDNEELYQLSDCYLFPVFSGQACIGVPLSVLEAMACNLPVVTLRYGSLPTMFEQGHGLLFAETREELLQGIAQTKRLNGCRTRDKVTPYSWDNIVRSLLGHGGPDEGKWKPMYQD
jgi:glycosyltransferase involved in cell wall biosynthesis